MTFERRQVKEAAAGVRMWPLDDVKSLPGVMVLVTVGVLTQLWRPVSVSGQITGTVMLQPPGGIVKPVWVIVAAPSAVLS